MQNEWYKISKEVTRFAAFYHRVGQMNLTGNMTEEDRIRAAIGLASSIDVYQAILKDRAIDKAKGKRTKRAAKEPYCEYLLCSCILRPMDTYSRASAMRAAQAMEAAYMRHSPVLGVRAHLLDWCVGWGGCWGGRPC